MELSAPARRSFNIGGRVSFRPLRLYSALLIFFGLVLISLFTPLTSHAQYPQSITKPNFEANVEQNQHTFIQSVTIEVMAAFVCQLSGIDVFNPQQGCLGINNTTHKIGYNSTPELGGLLGLGTSMIVGVYTPPASGINYFRNLASDFGIAKRTNAQTPTPTAICTVNPELCDIPTEKTGFDALVPVQTLWESSRNIAYLLFIIVFIILGVGIMLRIKIDPKVVMSVQNQVPKIIVSLLLITFSYAIVGLFIDFMWITTYFGINTLTAVSTTNITVCSTDPTERTLREQTYNNILNHPVAFLDDLFYNGNCAGGKEAIPASGVANLSWNVGSSIGVVISGIVKDLIQPVDNDCGWRKLKDCVAEGVSYVVQYVASIAGLLIALIAIVVSLMRLWWVLLKSYAYILIYTIMAPFYIILGLQPGSTLGFSRWIRTITANLLVFPAAALLILLTRVVFDAYGKGAGDLDPNLQFVAPLVGNPGSISFGPLLAFGLILLTPELLTMIRDALKAPANKYAGPAIAKGLGIGTAATGGLVGGAVGRAMRPGTGLYDTGFARERLVGAKAPEWRKRLLTPLIGKAKYDPHLGDPSHSGGSGGGGGGHS